MTDSGYMRAKVAQEELIRDGDVPWSVLRSTQFMEFIGGIAVEGPTATSSGCPTPSCSRWPRTTSWRTWPRSPSPLVGTVELGGPEALPIAELGRRWLRNRGDEREVVADHSVGYFGAIVDDTSLVAGEVRGSPTRFADWLATPAATM